jgi:hypothetical protein
MFFVFRDILGVKAMKRVKVKLFNPLRPMLHDLVCC